jgi:16S rRNA (uracil1498-N3)-methyltransferase
MTTQNHFLFYASAIEQSRLLFDQDETRHARIALRLHVDDVITATDGAGRLYTACISAIDRHELRADILTVAETQRAGAFTLFVGLPERDAFESLLAPCAALGVAEIHPVECRYCDKNWWRDGWARYAERFRKKLIAGMKQAMNPWIPILFPPAPFVSILERLPERLLVADMGGRPMYQAITADHNGQWSGMVGPPGGFSPEEHVALKENHACFVSLSPWRLRTELAATLLAGMVVSNLNSTPVISPDGDGVRRTVSDGGCLSYLIDE